MRRLFTLALFSLTFAVSGQELERNSLFVFVSNPEYTRSDNSGSNFGGAFGIAAQRTINDRWRIELGVSREYHRTRVTYFDFNGNVIDEKTIKSTSTPVDLSTSYELGDQSAKWRPYAGLGARWADARDQLGRSSHVMPTVLGGVLWQFRPSLGLRFDGKVIVANRSESLDVFNASVGLAWRF
jgi:hypothetical protein